MTGSEVSGASVWDPEAEVQRNVVSSDRVDGVDREIWRVSRAGSLGRLKRVRDRLAPLQPGEAQVAVEAVGLNFADVFACLGLYSATPKGAFVPGLEFSGTVEGVSESRSGNHGLKPGDRVMGLTRFGGFATRLNVGLAYLRPIPEGWNFSHGAAFAVQALTAWYALEELGALRGGQTVLVHSAAGGVGLNAVALGLRRSARLIATVGNSGKVEFLRQRHRIPANQIITRDPNNFPGQLDGALRAIGADGLDLILDSVAGPYFKPGYQRLLPGGRLILYGAADWMPKGNRPNYVALGRRYLSRPRLDPLNMIAENRSLMAFNLIWLWDQRELLARMFEKALLALPDPPFVGREFDFGEAPEALRFLQSGNSVGKVVLLV